MVRDLQYLADFKDEGRGEDVLTEHIEMSRTMRHGLRCVGMKGWMSDAGSGHGR